MTLHFARRFVNATGKTLFAPYAIRSFEGIKVGFIGLALKGVPDIVVPSGVAGLTFEDEAQTAEVLFEVVNPDLVAAAD